MLDLGHRNTRRRLQTPFRQGDIHGRGHIPLIFELNQQRLKRRIEGHALDFFTWNGPTTQLQLHKLIARVPIIARRGNGIAARDLHCHDRQAIVRLKRPGSSPTPTKRPDTTGNHHHDKDRKTDCDQTMMGTARLGRHVPPCLSIWMLVFHVRLPTGTLVGPIVPIQAILEPIT